MIDWQVVTLTLKLAFSVTLSLCLVCIPLAWWLSQTQAAYRDWVASIVTLPMVLPATVLGFYLLVFFSPNGIVGSWLNTLGLGTIPFSFTGVVIACVIHTLPFVVMPLRNGFESLGKEPFEAAATLGCSPVKTFLKVALPLSWPFIFSSMILGFCHALGEFGIVLMIGGNIPGETRVMSIEIYNLVESMEFQKAHYLSISLLTFSFVALMSAHKLNQWAVKRGGCG
ncbi:molybdenum transport system permease protein ModB [Vibrio astriarenae]|nr:molybdenum transport system permease protein ModB [Vibrio sp. C7]